MIEADELARWKELLTKMADQPRATLYPGDQVLVFRSVYDFLRRTATECVAELERIHDEEMAGDWTGEWDL